MAHDPAGDTNLCEGLLRSRHHVRVQRHELLPWRGSVGNVGDRAPIEKEVADVGGVELLLVLQRPWPLPTPIPPCLPTMSLDDLLLPGDVCLAALVADEGQADLIQIPNTPFKYFHQALADQRRDRRWTSSWWQRRTRSLPHRRLG